MRYDKLEGGTSGKDPKYTLIELLLLLLAISIIVMWSEFVNL